MDKGEPQVEDLDRISKRMISVEKYYSKNKFLVRLNKMAPQLNFIFLSGILIFLTIFGTPDIVANSILSKSIGKISLYMYLAILYGFGVLFTIIFSELVIIPRYKKLFPRNELPSYIFSSFIVSATGGFMIIMAIFLSFVNDSTMNYEVFGTYLLGIGLILYYRNKLRLSKNDSKY